MSSDSEIKIGFQPERLRVAREKRGLTQRDLGRLLGLGINQIHRYEHGTNDPTAEILSRMAYELSVTSDYLLGLSDAPTGYGKDSLRTDERQLLDAYTLGDSTAVVKLLTERIYQLESAQKDTLG